MLPKEECIMSKEDTLEHKEFKYQVVKLVNNDEFIIRYFDENDSSFFKCEGILLEATNKYKWVNLVINKSNILYTRDLFSYDKDIVRHLKEVQQWLAQQKLENGEK